ncbi:MAG: CopG family transcriptional regulator [Actinobacteria bacterium]|nr:CopG family transcriptional regulator [Actinomycetota bacterium]
MDNQNVTLSIPRELLKKAKHVAVERGVSLSGLMVQMLTEITRREDEYGKARAHHLAALSKHDLGTRGKAGWKRGDLHAR